MGEKNLDTTGPLRCGHCANLAPMAVVAKYFEEHHTPDDEHGQSFESGDGYELLKCPSCSKVSLRTYDWHEGMEPEDVVHRYLYPSNEALTGLPPKLQREYDAARKVRGTSADAYAVLIGRVLELICDDRAAAGRTLNEKLKDLATKGEIPPKLVDVADSLRALRNVGAHATLGSLSEQELPILDDLSTAILEYVYLAPQLVQRAASRIAQLKALKTATGLVT